MVYSFKLNREKSQLPFVDVMVFFRGFLCHSDACREGVENQSLLHRPTYMHSESAVVKIYISLLVIFVSLWPRKLQGIQ